MQLLTPSAEVEEEIKLYIAIVFPLKCILENPQTSAKFPELLMQRRAI